MQLNPEINNLPFDLPKNKSNVIKVIGVGGGGSNAINHMYSKGIKGVDYVVCNTAEKYFQKNKFKIVGKYKSSSSRSKIIMFIEIVSPRDFIVKILIKKEFYHQLNMRLINWVMVFLLRIF